MFHISVNIKLDETYINENKGRTIAIYLICTFRRRFLLGLVDGKLDAASPFEWVRLVDGSSECEANAST